MNFLSVILPFIYSKIKFLLCVFLFVILFCELYTRFPFLPQRLEYQVDEELISVLRPSQKGYDWLGNMSFKSPLISLNQDGHRGKETNWSNPVILAVGNSEAFGASVKDSDVWTYHLELLLKNQTDRETLQVVNASHLGAGPYQQYIRVKRALEVHQVGTIIVRVDLADRYFRPVATNSLPTMIKKAQLRQNLRRYTKGLPYLLNKVMSQLPSIKNIFRPKLFINKRKKAFYSDNVGFKMWQENKIWWNKIRELAIQKNITLIYMIFDAFYSDGCIVIEENLRHLTAMDPSTYVFRIGPDIFGLTSNDRDLWKKQFNLQFTLGRDPHANALQHKLIAHAAFEFMTNNNLIPKPTE
jgi:hypothetical protein